MRLTIRSYGVYGNPEKIMKSGVTKYVLPIHPQYIPPPIKQAYRPSFLMTTVCLFFIFSPVYQPIPTVIYTGEKMQEVSKGGCAAFGSGFPIGASNTLLAHDFPDNSEVFVRKV